MRCVITAGPTYEPLDQVRRLTNFSTGRLGCELANYLASRGHEVVLLIGQQATWRGERQASHVETFTTTANLRDHLRALSGPAVDAVFHAAAVSDFAFGRILKRGASGELEPIKSGKIPTRAGTLLAELVPTPKILAELRDWFPQARLVGWKYEVEGNRDAVLALARKQLTECRIDTGVANGPAYGSGFGLVRLSESTLHLPDREALFQALEALLLEEP